jgi:hypothetical protein
MIEKKVDVYFRNFIDSVPESIKSLDPEKLKITVTLGSSIIVEEEDMFFVPVGTKSNPSWLMNDDIYFLTFLNSKKESVTLPKDYCLDNFKILLQEKTVTTGLDNYYKTMSIIVNKQVIINLYKQFFHNA